MSEITVLLAAARHGDPAALRAVFDQLYPELRRIAKSRLEAGERTLTPTVLVHEAFVRLISNNELELNDRRHFLACAARAMRAIVIDQLRRRTAVKRGGAEDDVSIDLVVSQLVVQPLDVELLALDEALDKLDCINPRQREVVELRYFGGIEFADIAELMGCSERTAKREWERARAFLYAQIGRC
jgi:RNA polymerase sigma factor (TIGR02999 family)